MKNNKKVNLTIEQMLRVHEWLKKHKAEVREMNSQQLTEKLAIDFNFAISINTIKRLLKDLGIKLKVRTSATSGRANESRRRWKLVQSILAEIATEIGYVVDSAMQQRIKEICDSSDN